MNVTRLLVLTVILTWLTACSELMTDRSGGFAPVVVHSRGVTSWLAELHEARTMSPEMKQETRTDWEQAFEEKPSLYNRMRLVLLLVAGGEPVEDRERARILLQQTDYEDVSEGGQEFIYLLTQYIDGQEQAYDKIAEQNQRIEELEQQLHALTAIEQNIQQRENPEGNQ